jgi:hypothetical protein
VSPTKFALFVLCFLVFLLVMPVMADISFDDEVKNDKGTPYSFWFMKSSGHTVHFNNTSKSMEYLISVPHWLDAITPPMEQHFDQLALTLERILSDSSPHDGEIS